MNNKPAVITLSIGVLFLVATLAFAFNLGGVSDALPLGAQAAFGLGGCAFALIVCGLFALAHKPTQKELVEQNDERNVAILNRAKAKALDRMFYVFGALMVSLALMGADIGVVLLLVAAYLFVAGCMVYYMCKYQKEM